MYSKAADVWSHLHGQRSGILRKIERYAALTIPKVCYPEGYNDNSYDDSHDYQSIGAQGTNHLSNKLMLAMFAPSRPFAKLLPGAKAKAQAQQMKLTPIQLQDILANGEREAIKELDRRGQRPKLFQLMRHLIVAGNALLVLSKDGMRVMGIKKYVVRRNLEGQVLHICVKEDVRFDEIDVKIKKLLSTRFHDDTTVSFYKWIKKEDNGSYSMTQWVNEILLPQEYNGRWPADRCPYQAITWDLADEHDYGTGLVEEYAGDFEALSALSESVVDGAVQGTEYRWMVNPTGMTSIEELNASQNGDALAGVPEDVRPTQGGNPQAIETANAVLDKYEKRISRGFLMGSSIIRDAERVTQEEVRLTAQELETSYGGVYSTLAASVQKPVARWLFDAVDLNLAGADLDVTIVTGLDALSRNGDLENFRAAMGDMAAMAQVPPGLVPRIKYEDVGRFIGQGRNIDLSQFFLTDAEAQAQQEQAMQAQVAQEVATTAGNAAVTPQG